MALVVAIRTGEVLALGDILAEDPGLASGPLGGRLGTRTALHVVTDWPGYFPNGPQIVVIDDPGQTIILHPRGSGFSLDQVTNTRAQMADLQNAYKSAYEIFARGQQEG